MVFSEMTQALLQDNSSLEIAKNFYEALDHDHRNILKRASLEAALFLQVNDPRIYQAHSIFLQRDNVGIKGDVRDIVIEVPKNQIGISAKYNHTAKTLSFFRNHRFW
ncbi:MAG: hypothetical protein C4617_01185 [Candidatus Liberibacter europaeus]|uniref:Uncharacterized protein n=1 Tax=Candidatus Liberibacter europaeus TaxID=744859 RepID=A0A2T4VZ53_9HYPH|nr:hypothetical protein [Candidatus Liberibacter europaeus]PTL87045.1 MAG: hypothetical protein C4617_01185 [Candidatus Liberibacter europaeus]